MPRFFTSIIGRVRRAGELRIALALAVVALLLIGSMFLLSTAIRPVPLRLDQLGEDDVGLLVEVEGLVRSARHIGSNSLRLTLVDANATIPAFIPDTAPGSPDPQMLQPGARVRVAGELTKSAFGLEIETVGPRAVKLVAAAGSEPAPLRSLLDAPEYYRGMKVRTDGMIGQFTTLRGDLSIKIADSQAGALAQLVVLVKRDLGQTYLYRDEVEVVGTFGYGYENGPGWRLVVESDHHQVAKGAAQPPASARTLTIPDVLSDPESFEGMEIHVHRSLVLDTSDVVGSASTLSSLPDTLSVFIARAEWSRTDILPGDKVRVIGHLEYYRPRGTWELVVDSPDDITLE